jgi:hypothetical protein
MHVILTLSKNHARVLKDLIAGELRQMRRIYLYRKAVDYPGLCYIIQNSMGGGRNQASGLEFQENGSSALVKNALVSFAELGMYGLLFHAATQQRTC